MSTQCCHKAFQLIVNVGVPPPFVYYKLDVPVAATTPDAIAGKDLSLINVGVGAWSSVAGKLGNTLRCMLALSGPTWSELQRSDADFLFAGTTNGFTARCWFYLDDPNYVPILARVGGHGGGEGWQIDMDGLGHFEFDISDATHPYQSVLSEVIPVGSWTHVVWMWDKLNHVIKIKLNDGVWHSVNIASMDDGTSIVRIYRAFFQVPNNLMDELAIWKDVILTDAQITDDYNGGVGRTWPW